MSIIKKIHIEKFRDLKDKTINLGKPVNAIIGQNGTMKTTLLGMLAQPFSMTKSIMKDEKTIDGYAFSSTLKDKFKFSKVKDLPGEHKWTLTINKSVYEKEEFDCISILRDKKTNEIRFWSAEGRDEGMNYVQCPVIFLSLKRLIPIGEEKSIDIQHWNLTEDEKNFYISNYNRILISMETINDVDGLKSTNKSSLGPNTDRMDSLTISAGQDNIGKILLAVMSLKRLKDKYPLDFKGGLVFIDEIESTLYPASQEKLLEFLFEMAEKIKIQFIFTSHSMTVINYLKTGKYSNRANITYLRKVGENVVYDDNPTLANIENDLNVKLGKKSKATKIKVYCEDSVGSMFAKYFLPKEIKEKVEFMNVSLTVGNYKEFYRQQIPEFTNNIILLDGDVGYSSESEWKNYPKNTNVLLLPGKYPPEQLIYEMLFALNGDDSFWDSRINGYSKQICFRDFPNHLKEIDHIKQWFKSQKEFAGRAYTKFLSKWKISNTDEVEKFVTDFIKTYNFVANKTGYDVIEMKK